MKLEILPIEGMPEVRPGDDIGDMIAETGMVADGDVLVVTQKIVSKAENALVEIDATDPLSHKPLVEQESVRIVRRRGDLIIEVEGSPSEIDAQLGLIKQIARAHNPVDLREAQTADEAARIWLGRKSAFGAVGQVADYMCLDGTIPVGELPRVLKGIKEIGDKYGLKIGNVFHAGDGNMHPLIMFDANKPGDLELCEACGADVLRLCVEVGGCLTGEHGVGVEKRDLMGAQFSEADMEAQMWVKDVFDPAWLLNPAKVFPLETSRARREADVAQACA